MNDPSPATLGARLRDAAELLEAIARDRTVLDGLPAADRERLHRGR